MKKFGTVGLKKILFVVGSLFFITLLHAQKTFNVTIQLPKDSTLQFSISYDNGKEEIPLFKNPVSDTVINFKGKYYSEYAAININTIQENKYLQRYYFVNQQKATVIIENKKGVDNLLDHCTLNNALDFKEYRKGLRSYDSIASSKFLQFNKDEKALIKQMGDSSYYAEIRQLYKNVSKKQLEYIISNPINYYSHWFFRRVILTSGAVPFDTLLNVYNSIFPSELKNSEEGQFILNHIKGNLAIEHMGYVSPLFAKDINGKYFRIEDYKNKKDVLVIFGATWCVPCIRELPMIQEILKTASKERLEVVYVAYQSSIEEYRKMIEKYQMKWIHIYSDIEFINAFGGNGAIPRLYIIDKLGKIIYVNQNDKSYDIGLKRLSNLVSSNYLIE
jgi:thiol-disulfide isomerase/thioredoxin